MIRYLRHTIGRYLWPLVLLNLLFNSASGSEPASLEKGRLKEISESRTWQLLLGYTHSGHSEIFSDNFFLSAEGAHNPHAELLATLNAFSQRFDNPDENAQCRYRARYIFLSRQINLEKYQIPPVVCPAFEKFQYDGQLTGIKLVFASGYFGNPASYYGHLLLKLETDRKDITDLEKTAINFGAIYPPDENLPTYIFKGVLGGYDAIFNEQEYYRQSLNYGETDLRDVWEYELNLTTNEIALLTAHLWEIQGVNYQYFFFDRNCSFRMAKVIDVVLEQNLVEDDSLWQIPQHLVQQLSNIQHHAKSLIKNIRYLPSRQSRLYQRYLDLTEQEKLLLNKIIEKTDLLEGDEFNNMILESQYRILDTLLDYYQYLLIKKYQDEAITMAHYQKVLSKRFMIPPGISHVQFSFNDSPEEGRKPSYIQMGVVNKNNNSEISLKIRPAYYDGLDYDSGHIKNSSLSMGELDLITEDNNLYIRSIGIVKIESLQRNVTGLPGDKVHSWYVDSGLINNIDECNDCFDLMINSGIGITRSLLKDSVIVSAFFGGGFFGNSLKEEALHSTARLLINVNVSAALRFQMEARNDYFIKEAENKNVYIFEGRNQISKNSDFRIKVVNDEDVKYSMAAGFYW